MTKTDRMRAALETAFEPLSLRIRDDSARHAGHAGASADGETHFRVEITSARFSNLPRIARHRLVNDALSAFFREGLHALEIQAKAPGEL